MAGCERPRSGMARVNPPPGHRPPQRSWWTNVWWLALLAVMVYNITSLINSRPNANPQIAIPYSTFITELNASNVASVSFQGNAVQGTLKHSITFNSGTATITSGPGAPSSAAPSASASPSSSASSAATAGEAPSQVQTSDRFS